MEKTSKPAIVQSDNTILLEVNNADYEQARDAISPFAELEKSPEHIHTYRITALSLWNAASIGHTRNEIIDTLRKYSRYEVPQTVVASVTEQMMRYGLLYLEKEGDKLILKSKDSMILEEISHNKRIDQFVDSYAGKNAIYVKPELRGHLKQALIKIGFPVEDLAGYENGDPLEIGKRDVALSGRDFNMRDYQESAVNAFYCSGTQQGGSGVIVLPCGSGKTIVGIGAITRMQTETLILVTNTVALRQWRDEIIDKTTISPEQIGEFSGDKKEIKPITIATYNILTYRKKKETGFTHFGIFGSKNWGLIIYDEVHLLPAPVFRMTSEIQSKRRLGLTATLVREDGMETDVFSLIGPKKFDIPWKILEKTKWIAKAECIEIRITLPDSTRYMYSVAKEREKFRIASENDKKTDIVYKLLQHHSNSSVLIIGQYISQLTEMARKFKLPLITGSTPTPEREQLYARFRSGEIKALIVSKVANFSIDLPDANVAIQISGTFGSRQEEAQRLGRVLRPKKDENIAHFYTVITTQSAEEKFAHNRQLFLTEQGYSYTIMNEEMFDAKYS
ncbi:MAG TPA: DEAD/DEAH box helicase [Spirochaetota bacterium]|nr:DEAD/DEAH box helicase [Spirochaetota bacterium]HPM33522.1 DEAD/DEAH box helicase [Spirochaetota bacterium]HPY02258.1 DEAD/DEAH box helicase [Spirochaetota bacterium]